MSNYNKLIELKIKVESQIVYFGTHCAKSIL